MCGPAAMRPRQAKRLDAHASRGGNTAPLQRERERERERERRERKEREKREKERDTDREPYDQTA